MLFKLILAWIVLETETLEFLSDAQLIKKIRDDKFKMNFINYKLKE